MTTNEFILRRLTTGELNTMLSRTIASNLDNSFLSQTHRFESGTLDNSVEISAGALVDNTMGDSNRVVDKELPEEFDVTVIEVITELFRRRVNSGVKGKAGFVDIFLGSEELGRRLATPESN